MKRTLIFFGLLIISALCFSQKKAGDISPKVKMIQADIIFPYRNGSSLIRKGSAYALIDEKADFIVPFNVYKEISYKELYGIRGLPSATGIYEIRNFKPPYLGFINHLGKKIYSPPLGIDYVNEQFGIGIEDFASVNERHLTANKKFYDLKYVCFNANGLILRNQNIPHEGMSEYTASSGTPKPGKIGFKNIKGEVIIAPQFDEVSYFSEGLAAVGRKNEFGETKWGYVDTKGKMVIPYKYSIRPGDFGNGLAFISAVVVEDFKFALINKQGDIVHKIPISSAFEITKFQNGYAFSSSDVLDTSGKIFPETELFQLFNLPTTYLIETKPFFNNQMYYHDKKKGLLDFSTKKYIPAIFDELSMFDPVSNLAYAKLFIRYDTLNARDIYREGYINKEGVFVIIKSDAEKF